MCSLSDVFQKFCAAHGSEGMNSWAFWKVCKDCNLFGVGFGAADADLIFAKVVPPSSPRLMNFEQFSSAVDLIADAKCVSLAPIYQAVLGLPSNTLPAVRGEVLDRQAWCQDDTELEASLEADTELISPNGAVFHTVHETFQAFCTPHSDMDGKSFARLCKDCCVDKKFSLIDADIIFAKVVAKGQRRIELHQFEEALRLVAAKKGMDLDALRNEVARTKWPTVRATKVGSIRLHDRSNNRSHSPARSRRGGDPAAAVLQGSDSMPSKPARPASTPSAPSRLARQKLASAETVVTRSRRQHADIQVPDSRLAWSPVPSRESSPVRSNACSPRTEMGTTTSGGSAASNKPVNRISMDAVLEHSKIEDVFRAFCGTQTFMDGKSFVKLWQECKMIDASFSTADADIVFAKSVGRGHKRMDLQQFLNGLELVANKKGLDIGIVRRIIADASVPAQRVTRADASRPSSHQDHGSARARTPVTAAGSRRALTPGTGSAEIVHYGTGPSPTTSLRHRTPVSPGQGRRTPSPDSAEKASPAPLGNGRKTPERSRAPIESGKQRAPVSARARVATPCSLQRSRPAASPKGENVSLTPVNYTFTVFCGAQSCMDGKSFAKLCKDCGLIDKSCNVSDIDLIFANVVSKGQRRIDLPQFEAALQLVANRKGLDVDVIRKAVAGSMGPVRNGTQAENVRFYDRRKTSSFSASQHGNPDTDSKADAKPVSGTPNLVWSQAPCLTRTPSAQSSETPSPVVSRSITPTFTESQAASSATSPPGGLAAHGRALAAELISERDWTGWSGQSNSSQLDGSPAGGLAVGQTFAAFCGPVMTAKRFSKLCADCQLYDARFGPVDADLAFAQVLPAGSHRLDLRGFEHALKLVANIKGVDESVVKRAVHGFDGVPPCAGSSAADSEHITVTESERLTSDFSQSSVTSLIHHSASEASQHVRDGDPRWQSASATFGGQMLVRYPPTSAPASWYSRVF